MPWYIVAAIGAAGTIEVWRLLLLGLLLLLLLVLLWTGTDAILLLLEQVILLLGPGEFGTNGTELGPYVNLVLVSVVVDGLLVLGSVSVLVLLLFETRR